LNESPSLQISDFDEFRGEQKDVAATMCKLCCLRFPADIARRTAGRSMFRNVASKGWKAARPLQIVQIMKRTTYCRK
jgi:hypothetical protein